MKQNTILAALPCLGALMFGGMLYSSPSAAHRFDDVNVYTWETKADPDFFPEMDDTRVNVPWLKDRPSFGIAFSGGGTRSAAATLGELRALDKLGWIDRAQYISANSGGSWTVQPFIYLPKNLHDETFLGAYVPPSKINDNVLDPNSEADNLSMSSAIYRSIIGDKISSIRRGDEAYADIIGTIFLEPFGLHDRKRVFTFHDKALQAVLKANQDLMEGDFYTIARNRPYPIIVGSLRVPLKEDSEKSELFLIEATPLYTGVRNEFSVPIEKKGSAKEILIGGGYVESFGYDSFEPKGDESNNGLWNVRLEGKLSKGDLRTNKRYRFTLSDVIGMSGAAPAITIADKNIHLEVFPEFRHWAVDRKKILSEDNLRDKAKELKHGDGGDIDNLALMPLLARKVENILVFINTRTPFPKNADCSDVSTDIMVDDLISLFRPVGKLKNNVVIEDQDGKKLETLCQQFASRKTDDKPLMYCDNYDIRDNHRQAVRGDGYRPSICWAYLDRTGQWIEELNASGGEKTSELKAGLGDFDNFPHYQTFNEKKTKLIDLNRERVHALSNLTAWTVLERKAYLAEKLAGASLPTDQAPAD